VRESAAGWALAAAVPGVAARDVTVEVSLNGADWGGDSVQFRYKGVCVMRSVVPSMGTEEGGTIVTVHGRGFKEGGRVWCRFGRRAEAADVVSDGEGMSDAGERRS
jgi:hypothetical protein